MFIFLDESGQFTKHDHESFFIVGSFTVGDPRRTEKQFRSWQQAKFPRKMRNQPEIKFSDVNIGEQLRKSTLEFISQLDVRVQYTYLLRDNIPDNYRDKGRFIAGIYILISLEKHLKCIHLLTIASFAYFVINAI